MSNKLTAVLAAGIISMTMNVKADSNHFEGPSFLAESLQRWDTGDYKHWKIKKASKLAQGYTGNDFSHGWCTDFINYALIKTGQFDHVKIATGFVDADSPEIMRGRHYLEQNNPNVSTQKKSDGPISFKPGDVVMLDWDGQADEDKPGKGIDHVTMFVGMADQAGYGWFIGGNQNGTVQPKMYALDTVTYNTRIEDKGLSSARFFSDINNVIKLDSDSTWTHSGTTYADKGLLLEGGYNYGKTKDGFKGTNTKGFKVDWNKDLWQEHGLNIQRFDNGTNTIYINTDKSLVGYKDFIVTQDYIDDYSDAISQAVINKSGQWASNLHERMAFVLPDTKYWWSRVFKKAKVMTDAQLQTTKELVKTIDSWGYADKGYGLKWEHRASVALKAVNKADKEHAIHNKDLYTEEGRNEVGVWSDIVTDSVLSDGLLMHDFGLQLQSMVNTINSPIGELN